MGLLLAAGRTMSDRIRDLRDAVVSHWRLAAGAVSGAVVLAVGLSTIGIEEPTPGPEPRPSPTRTRPTIGPAYTNRTAGYTVIYRPGWEVTAEGTQTTITSPDGEALVSIGLSARSSNLYWGYRELLDGLSSSYRSIDVEGSRVDGVGDRTAIFLSGSFTNRRDEKLRFTAVVVEGTDRDVVAIGYRSSDATASMADLRTIISSIRASV